MDGAKYWDSAMNYYNEFDPKAAAWIRELIKAGMIPDGEVDERSITDVRPKDLDGFVQCHFFAGIGGWPYALRLAGWPDSRPVWTGSCPCQPFSVAGKGKGLEDERHLWPAFRWLIAQCRPRTIFGEQVASQAAVEWLAGVYDDLETLGYQVPKDEYGDHEAYSLPAASVGAPHIRQRLWWVGYTKDGNREIPERESRKNSQLRRPSGFGGMVNLFKPGLEGHAGDGYDRGEPGRNDSETAGSVAAPSDPCRLGISNGSRPQQVNETAATVGYRDSVESANFWNASVWWPCIDGKWRRVPARQDKFQGRNGTNTAAHEIQTDTLCPESSLFPLADGVSGRAGLLRGAGNAIVPQVAAEFIGAFLKAKGDIIEPR